MTGIDKLITTEGEMSSLIRDFDWSATPIGPMESWPQSLYLPVNTMLSSGYPMYIAWGPEFIQLYNDAYRPILGLTKHPDALGKSTVHTFSEIWDFIGPMFNKALQEGKATFFEQQLLTLDRNGYLEECSFYARKMSPVYFDIY